MRVSIGFLTAVGMLLHALPAFAQAVVETEPNGTPATANAAVLGTTATGAVGHPEGPADSVDYWVLHANAGDTIYVAVSACRTCIDAGIVLSLLGADGVTTLAAGTPWDANDEQLAYVARSSGSYYVRVTATIYSGDQMPYTLSFKERKCPGQELVGEPNNSRALATPLTLGSQVHGFWCPNGDVDLYRVSADVGTILEFGLTSTVRDGFADPGVQLLDADGQSLGNQVEPTSTDGIGRYEVVRSGPYYLAAVAGRGRIGYPYDFYVKSAGTLPSSPGDPPTLRASEFASMVLAADRAGNLWSVNGGIIRLALDGTRTTYQNIYRVPGITGFAWDAYGNMLLATPIGVRRFAPPNMVRPFIDRLGAGGLAVDKDGIWLGELEGAWDEVGDINDPAHRSHSALHRYNLDGQLQVSYPLSAVLPYSPQEVVLGPSGDPYFSAGTAIYRLAGGQPQLVLRHGVVESGWITSFAFDRSGRIYVAGHGRVSLYDPAGAILNDPFSWWPFNPISIAFGRGADGSPNTHLYALDQLNLVELNPAGVSTPGLTVGVDPVCPASSEAEPNGGPETARPISLDTTVTGMSCPAGDQDFFRVTASAGKLIQLALWGADEPILTLVAGDGRTRIMVSEDTVQFRARGDSGGLYRQINYTPQTAGTYYVAVGSRFGGPRPYTLRVGTPLLGAPASLTLARAAREFVRPGIVLNADELRYLDTNGNNNGRYDLGDFRAYFQRRQQQGQGAHP